uniref:Zn(2)-C6 fungal-type domain-containing protein n=1 Tax=Ganoderma boninense TaxID=34458 RepID=A0A5K1JVP8_9APHY|nr:Zn(2)-C6 fungal-type domain-containing protein [Ganoderma boninense]
MLASKIHYAFPTRPPVGSPLRTSWDDRFLEDVILLIKALNSATFKSLPTIAMGCVWAANCRLRETPRRDTLNIDAIQPVVPGHPALDKVLPKGMKRLTYEPDDFGVTGLLPEEGLPDRWWARFVSADRSPLIDSGSCHPETDEARAPSARAWAQDILRDNGTASAGENPVAGEMEGAERTDVSVEAPIARGSASNAQSTLASIPPETLPNTWIEHKCSLTFSVGNQSLSGFLAWAYWKILSLPLVFGDPTFTPDSFSTSNMPPISGPPSWFQTQFGVKPEPPQDVAPAAGDALAAESPVIASSVTTRSSARSVKGKERAPISEPSASTALTRSTATPERTARPRVTKALHSASAAPNPHPKNSQSLGEPSSSAPPNVCHVTTRSKSRPQSGKKKNLTDDLAHSGLGPKSGSSVAPIDVDAMDVDAPARSTASLINTSHIRFHRSPLRMRGSEFSYETTSSRRPSPSPVGETESPPESPMESPIEQADATVPPIEGSWRALPRLDDVLAKLQSATVGDPESDVGELATDTSPATLDDLLPISDNGGTALPETEQMKSNLIAVSRIVQCTKEWAETLTAQSKRVLDRTERAMGHERDWNRSEVIDSWFNESQDLGDDVARLSRQLADTNTWVSLLACCLKDLMASPIDGDTLQRVLTEVARLKYAYEDSVRKFAALQEDVRPVRREVHRLRWRTDAVERTAEVAANEAARAVEPILANLYSQLSAEIAAVRIAVSGLMERLATAIAQPGGLTAPMLHDIIGAIREAVAEMWRTTTSISQFIEGAWIRLSSSLSAKVTELEERLLRIEGTPTHGNPGEATATAAISLPKLARAMDALGQRVDALQREAADDQAFDRRVRESLGRLALTQELGEEDPFDRRLQQSLARLGITGDALQLAAARLHGPAM